MPNGGSDSRLTSLRAEPSEPEISPARKGPLSSLGAKKTFNSDPSPKEASDAGPPDPFEEVASLRGHRGWVRLVLFSLDRTIVASGGSDGGVKLWRFAHDGGPERTVSHVHPGGVQALALSSDNARLASAASQPEGTVRLWDLAGTRPKLRALLQVPKAPVDSLAFSPTGNLLGVGCDKSVLLWNATKPAPREDRALIGHREAVKSMAFAPDGLTLATGSLDGTVRLWSTDLAQPQELSLLEGSKAGIHAVAFSTDGKLLAWEGMDHTVQVGEVKRANQLITLRGHKGLIRMILFPADGTTLLTVDDKNWVFLWDLNSGSIVRRWLLPGGTTLASIGCTSDGRYLVAGTMGIVTVYRLYPKNKCSSKEGQK